MESVCHGCMSILQYVKLIWGSGFSEIYMLEWRRGWGSVCHGYVCIHLYVKLIWCSHSAEIYAHLEERSVVILSWVYVHFSICEYFFVVLLFHRSIFEWRRALVKSAMGICCGFVEIYAHLEERV